MKILDTRSFIRLLAAGFLLACPVFSHAGEIASLKPRLNVPRSWTLNRIAVDGDLRDRAWEQGTLTYGFVAGDGQSAPEASTRARIIHDYHGIYVGFTAFQKGAEGTVKDRVGLKLAFPDANGKQRELSLSLQRNNALEAKLDGSSTDSAGIETAVKPGKDLWDAEIFIPYESIGAEMPSHGDIWHASFHRERPMDGNDVLEFSSWLASNATGELRFGRDLLVYLYSKRPFYAADEIMVYNYSDKLRRLGGEYIDDQGNTVQEVTVHLGPGHRRQHYRMDGVSKGTYYVVVRDRDARPGEDDVLMVMPRPQFGN